MALENCLCSFSFNAGDLKVHFQILMREIVCQIVQCGVDNASLKL